MKIGILTFHWATNYGAVMQCYALQHYLEEQGHIVEVINYKPRQYDDSIYAFFRFRKFLKINNYIENRKKETSLDKFRKEKLNLTSRVYSYVDIPNISAGYDVIISGSDQVLNPSFLQHGEKRGVVSPTYFLGFPFEGRKVGYALSFGCVSYPQNALPIASKYIQDFNFLGVREKTGVDIVSSMGRKDATVVPDPTLLRKSEFYSQLADVYSVSHNQPYVYSFFIRHIVERRKAIGEILQGDKVLWNNEDGNFSMEGWLSKIKHAKLVITDSFHCMVMCLKLHVPFAVVTELKDNMGMNDRFYTLLEKMSLSSIIIHKKNIGILSDYSNIVFDWGMIDKVLEEYFHIGEDFLLSALR